MARRKGSGAIDHSNDFDLTNSDFDDPTELPGPWTPPPDPEFQTGTILAIEHADLAAGVMPGVEPADSPMETVRFSRLEMQELIAPHLQARRSAQVAAPAPEPARAESRPARSATPTIRAPAPVARSATQAARSATPAALAATPPAGSPVAAPAAAAVPPLSAMQVPAAPGMQVVVAHRWQVHHVAIAFAVGVLTGVLATTLAVLATHQ